MLLEEGNGAGLLSNGLPLSDGGSDRLYDPEMNFLCGDALGASCGTWIAFWNGAIGAFVAAILGGLVALLVVRSTNGQQKRLASEGRERAAIAELLAATGAMLKKYREGPVAVQDLLLAAEAAAIRWSMESKYTTLGDEIRVWPYYIGQLALDAWDSNQAHGKTDAKTFAAMTEAWSVLSTFGRAWPHLDEKTRLEAVERLSAGRRAATNDEESKRKHKADVEAN